MSFLDATGLGTFWAKLKNYFVPATKFQGPVSEDLKDMLTPENMLPNCDFSRNGAYKTTFNTVPPINNSWYLFRQSWDVNRLNNADNNSCTVTNFTISPAKNSLAISFDKTQGTFYFLIRNNNTFIYNDEIYTFMGDVFFGSTNYNNNIKVSFSTAVSNDTIHFSDDPTHKVNVLQSKYNGTANFKIVIYTGTDPEDEHLLDAGHVSIVIKNLALYKGEFKDCPIKLSPDTEAGNQFGLKNVYDNVFYNASGNYIVKNMYYDTTDNYKCNSMPRGENIGLYLFRSTFARASYSSYAYFEGDIIIYPTREYTGSNIFRKYEMKIFLTSLAGGVTIKKSLTLDSTTSFTHSDATTVLNFPDFTANNIAVDTGSANIYVQLKYTYTASNESGYYIGMEIIPRKIIHFNLYSETSPQNIIHFNRE